MSGTNKSLKTQFITFTLKVFTYINGKIAALIEDLQIMWSVEKVRSSKEISVYFILFVVLRDNKKKIHENVERMQFKTIPIYRYCHFVNSWLFAHEIHTLPSSKKYIFRTG